MRRRIFDMRRVGMRRRIFHMRGMGMRRKSVGLGREVVARLVGLGIRV